MYPRDAVVTAEVEKEEPVLDKEISNGKTIEEIKDLILKIGAHNMKNNYKINLQEHEIASMPYSELYAILSK